MFQPNLSHLKPHIFRDVYEPDSDSFCLMDALESDFFFLENLCPRMVLDVGSGSGILSAHLLQILNHQSKKNTIRTPNVFHVLCADINMDAARATQQTLSHVITQISSELRTTASLDNTPVKNLSCTSNSVLGTNPLTLSKDGFNSTRGPKDFSCSIVRADLTTSALQRWASLFHVILWNPPYVPTTLDEVAGYGIDRACAGGPGGVHQLFKMAPYVISLLHPHGVMYLLLVEANDPENVRIKFSAYGLSSSVVLSRFSGERYTVLKFVYPCRNVGV